MMVRRAPVRGGGGGLTGGVAVLALSPSRSPAGGETQAGETVGTTGTDTRIGKLDQLYNIR